MKNTGDNATGDSEKTPGRDARAKSLQKQDKRNAHYIDEMQKNSPKDGIFSGFAAAG